jgi:hypothetical protein
MSVTGCGIAVAGTGGGVRGTIATFTDLVFGSSPGRSISEVVVEGTSGPTSSADMVHRYPSVF